LLARGFFLSGVGFGSQDHKDNYAEECAAHDSDEGPHAVFIACEQFVSFRITWRLRFHSGG
jgi:hypothetical protein